MGTLLFRNVVTPTCRQIPDCPQILSLRGRAGLYLLEDTAGSLCRLFKQSFNFHFKVHTLLMTKASYAVKLKEEEFI